MSSFIVIYDRTKGLLQSCVEYSSRSEALAGRLEAELQRSGSRADLEVVLLEADSLEELRQTHPSYFETVRELAKRSPELIDPVQHNTYLDVVSQSTPVGDAMKRMAGAARSAGDALTAQGFTSASLAAVARVGDAMGEVKRLAAQFLDRLSDARPPEYMLGANHELRDALSLLITAADRGIVAVEARDVAALGTTANEMNASTDQILRVADRITNWFTGAARSS